MKLLVAQAIALSKTACDRLTIAEVAEVEDGMVIIDCVAIFYEEGKVGEHYRNKNTFRCRVSRIEKRLVKLKEKIW